MTDDIADAAELLVIGGGPGGYTTAIEAGRAGLDVVLVSDEPPGGTCLNHGCIPSKALLSASDRVTAVANETAEEMGIYADPYVDIAELFDWKDGVVSDLTGGVASLCRSNGVQVVEGRATFASEQRTHIETPAGEADIDFEQAVLATGSRPVEIPQFSFEDERILSSRDALALEAVPDELVVIGAGYIGMELSTVFARLGAAVTVVEMRDQPLPQFDESITAPVLARARKLGIDFHFEAVAETYTPSDRGLAVETDAGTFTGDSVLVAVGREPVTDSVGLDAGGVEYTDDGFVQVDDRGRTTSDRIFAVGDVTGGAMLAHEAMMEGERVAAVLVDEEPRPSGTVPAVVYTEPEIGVVGLTTDDATAAGYEPVEGHFRLSGSGRALTAGAPEGMARVVADRDSGRLLGAQVVGRDAAELLGEATLAVGSELTLAAMAETIHAHPTLSEAWKKAAANALRSLE